MSQSSSPSQPGKSGVWAAFFFGATFFALLLMELTLRVVPIEGTSHTTWKFDKQLGWLWDPQNTSEYARSCFRNKNIFINSYGFRGPAFKKRKKALRVLVLGDSYMEALQIPEGEYFAPLLAKMSGMEAMQLGHRGIGPSHAMAIYALLGKRFKPDVVVLGYLLYNDALDDWEPLGNSHPAWAGAARMAPKAGQWQIIPPQGGGQALAGKGVGLQKHLYLWRFFRHNQAAFLARGPGQKNPSLPWYGNELAYQNYVRAKGEVKKAWWYQEKVLENFRDRVLADGARFVVMTIPGPMEQAPDKSWAARLALRGLPGPMPADFDPDLPHRRFMRLSKKLGLETVDLVPVFKNRPQEMRNGEVRWSLPCDGHWTKEGHQLAARTMADYLKRHPRKTKAP